jgi:hypothetical protein
LDLVSWEDLPVWRGQRDFLLLADEVPRGGLRLDAALPPNAWRDAIRMALCTRSEACLVEVTESGNEIVEATYLERDGRIELGGLRQLADDAGACSP